MFALQEKTLISIMLPTGRATPVEKRKKERNEKPRKSCLGTSA
jgi:hypothetical protein